MTIKQDALSHAQAYITDEDWRDDRLQLAVNKTKTIQELLAVQKQFPKTQHYDIQGFYKAMLKVCPYLRRKWGHAEHTGTECRGWFRVYSAIKENSGYFCNFDLGRDQWMATTFLMVGAITEQDFARYKTLLTLKQAVSVVQADGTIDVSKMRDYWQEDAHDQVFNMPLLRAIESVA